MPLFQTNLSVCYMYYWIRLFKTIVCTMRLSLRRTRKFSAAAENASQTPINATSQTLSIMSEPSFLSNDNFSTERVNSVSITEKQT